VSSKGKRIVYAMSRRRRNLIIGLCLAVAVVFVRLDRRFVGHRRQGPLQTGEQTSLYDLEKYGDKQFTVVNVVDGDTIDVDIPDGEYERTRIRLWGLDTPETKSEEYGVMYFGPEAAEFTRKLALGKKVCLYLDPARTRDKYDRLLAYVLLPNGSFLNEVLLTEGFAYADLRFEHNFYHRYRQLEAAARSGKRGLWQKVKREQMPEWLQRKRPKLLRKK